MKIEDYKHLISTAPFGYAYHHVILDHSGKPVDYESPRAHSPRLAAGLASKNSNSYGIEESSLAARFFNFLK